MRKRAYRAAGQAIAAIVNGVAIDHVDGDGIELAPTPGRHRRAEALAEIAMGLAGIAAEDRDRFGTVGAPDFVASWNFNHDQLADFNVVRGLIDAIDPRGTDDTLFLAWLQAVDLVADPIAWRAIEAVAAALDRGRLSESDVQLIMSNISATAAPIGAAAAGATGSFRNST